MRLIVGDNVSHSRKTRQKGRKIPSFPAVLVGMATLWIAIGATPCHADTFDPAAIEFFERDIRPLLVQRCYECHGDVEKPKGGLKLTSRASILAGGDSGPAAVPGMPQKSLLIEAVGYDGALQMPPKEKLSRPSVDRLATWIVLGLPWPADESTATGFKEARPFRITQEQKKFWSFQPFRVVAPPAVRDETWPHCEIDRFILSELERHRLSPAPRANKRTLLRRATYDLTGLPPTPEELDAFEADDSPRAFAKVVDRLLASPAYGERWGRHWLDVVRYADSRDARYVGAGHDITEAWRYRDCVINAMNRDLPYNEFILQQVAGDLLPASAPGGINVEGLVATGFLAVGEWGTGDSDAAKMHTDMVDDQVNVVSRAFLALTMSCARCHDHKFDPISTADYYALAGIFFSTQIATPQTSAQMVRAPLVPKAEVDKFNQYMAGITEKEKGIQRFTDEQYGLLIKSSVPHTARYLMAAWDFRNRPAEKAKLTVSEMATERGLRADALGQWLEYLGWTANNGKLLSADRSPDSPLAGWFVAAGATSSRQVDRAAAEAAATEVQRLVTEVAKNPPPTATPGPHGTAVAAAKLYQEIISEQGPYRIAKRDNDKLLPTGALQKLKSMNEEIVALKKHAPPPLPLALVAREGGVPGTKYAGFNDVKIHVRGRYDRLGEVVPRRFPEVLAGAEQPRITAGSGRLELGRWLARAENPLTARVMVNRIWQHHFGAGLVRTPGNFGTQGDPPTHPALLDFLAHRFIESGWSLKAMHRMMMLSAVYQQAATPTKETLHVDPENRLCSRANIRRLEAEEIRDAMLTVAGKLDRTMRGPAIRDPAHQRRAVYSMTIRSIKSGFPFLFDMADPEIVADQRTISTVAPQSLFLMNNEFVLGLTSSLAARICRDAGDAESGGIERAYALLYGRAPMEHEIAVGREFLDRARKRIAGESQRTPEPAQVSRQAWEAYCQALLCANELIYLD